MISMSIIEANEFGRIYIRNFQVSKYVYNMIKEQYPHINCYFVGFKNNEVNIKIRNQEATNIQKVFWFQDELKKHLKENLSVHVEKVNIIFG